MKSISPQTRHCTLHACNPCMPKSKKREWITRTSRVMTMLVFAAFLSFPAFAANKEKESAYERIMRTGTIRCGYVIWNPVHYIEANTGTLKGFGVDIMEEIGKRLDLEIEWTEEATFGTILGGLLANRYDMICGGLYQNAARGKHINFSMPYFYSPTYVVVRAEDSKFSTHVDFNNSAYTITVQEGEAGSIFAQENYPDANFISIPQMADYTQLYETLVTKKADLSLVDLASFHEFDTVNPGILKLFSPDNPVTVFPVTFGLPQKDMAFKTMIDSSIIELHNTGVITRLMKKYNVLGKAFLPVAKPYEVQK